MIPRLLLLAALGVLVPACQGSVASGGDACPALAKAESMLEVAPMPAAGCSADEPGNVCGVDSGGMSCTSVCASGEYEVTCRSNDPASVPVPDPSPRLGCRTLPLPAPNGMAFYCCPCAA